jgi:hypothetical protein
MHNQVNSTHPLIKFSLFGVGSQVKFFSFFGVTAPLAGALTSQWRTCVFGCGDRRAGGEICCPNREIE